MILWEHFDEKRFFRIKIESTVYAYSGSYHGLCNSLMFACICSKESVLGIGMVFCRGFLALKSIHRPVFVLCKLLYAHDTIIRSVYFM